MICDTDRWVFFGESMSKGKKNDHVFHSACLDYLIKFYAKKREEEGLPEIKVNIVWTDQCPNQYKCRQNFYNVSTFAQRHDSRSTIIHKFAAKYRFKGSWDAYGKIIKERIKNNELKYDRCATAWDCYVKLRKQLSKNDSHEDNQKYKMYEETGDERVLLNTTFKAKATYFGYATEDKGDYDSFSDNTDYDHIVFTDRSNELSSTMKKLDDTLKLGQVQGASECNPRTGKCTIRTAFLPCSCSGCKKDPSNYLGCKYGGERNSKEHDIVMKNDVIINPDDVWNLNVLTVAELREEVSGRGIHVPKSLLKKDLIGLLTDILNDEVDTMNDD